MTFEEALFKKKQIGEHIQSRGFKMRVMVVPINQHGFMEFQNRFKSIPNRIRDTTAKKYSYGEGFTVVGLYTDGASVYSDSSI